ncbi:Endonuclease/exonuclease/phosphatase [Chaetomium strumarium]|uniref:Endonuclease/exonuclease/phosphatase n=1 Tax=Chaetomium strumarium TaxID=1170767 RepID=A0AAJ0M2D2_9PEZI|nr:Endonuclease/exonuclease/phosphatase [Chaetomium strumarium]
MMNRDISPPPAKRRRVAPAAISAFTDSESKGKITKEDMRLPSIRLFSWNINGIGPLLPSQTTRITSFFKPLNGDWDNSPAAGQPKLNGLRAFLSRHNWPEVLFLQELKIAEGDSKTLAALLSALNTPSSAEGDKAPADTRTYTLDAALPRDRFNVRGFQGKLYGVGTILRTDFAREHVARVRDVDWDREGRVSIVELKNKKKKKRRLTQSQQHEHDNDDTTDAEDYRRPLALINVYAVNGTSAPYRSPRDGGRAVGTRHDHKRAFHSRLRDECLALEARGFHVVVAGDVNVARGRLDGYPNLRSFPREHCANRADFNVKFFGPEDNARAQAYCGVHDKEGGDGEKEEEKEEQKEKEKERCLDAVDVFRAMHGAERRYTYYPRSGEWGSSCDRVDMVFVSKGLWGAGQVLGTGILDTPQERGLSDHVPLWVEIAMAGSVNRASEAS